MYFDHIHFKLSLEENLKIIGSIVKEINIKTRQLTSSSTNVWHFYTTLFNAQPFLKTATRTHHMISACHVIHVLHIHVHIVIHVGWCNKNKVISISTAGCAIGLLPSIKLITILQQLFYIWTCPLTHKEIGQIQEICTEVLIHTACMSTATVKYGCHQWQLLHLKIGANGGHSYFSCLLCKTCAHKRWCSFGAVIKSSELCGADLVQLFSYPYIIITLWCSFGAVNLGTNI